MPPSSTESMVPELDDLRTGIDNIVADARKLTANLSEQQFNWRPEPGKWSIAQCLAHLNANGPWFLTRADQCIREAREKGILGRGPYRHGLIGGFFLRILEPPPKKKVKTREALIPPASESPAKTIPAFLALQDEVRKRIREAYGIDLGRAKLESPITPWLKFSLGQSFAIFAAHERRHLWQAWQVRNDPKFPAS